MTGDLLREKEQREKGRIGQGKSLRLSVKTEPQLTQGEFQKVNGLQGLFCLKNLPDPLSLASGGLPQGQKGVGTTS